MRYWFDLFGEVRRSLRSGRPWTALAAANMALGIAAATVALSIVEATLWRPLPYPGASRIVELAQPSAALGRPWPFTYRFFDQAREHLPGIQALAALSFSDLILQTDGPPQVVETLACSASLADVLRAGPLKGSFFTRADEIRNPLGSVALISDELWRSAFAGRQDILGRKLQLEGRTFQVIGVMPAGMRVPPLNSAPAVWIPLGSDPVLDQLEKMFPGEWDRSAYLSLWARVEDGVDASVVAERVRAAALPLLAETDPDYTDDLGFQVISLERQIGEQYWRELLILVLATLLALAVSCANFSSLILAREPSRRPAASIRHALGASSPRIAAVAILEGLVIAGVGASLGALASLPLFRLLETQAPQGLLPIRQFSLNGEVLGAAVLVSVACALAVSWRPALRLARLSSTGLTGGAARSLNEGPSVRRGRQAVVAVQVGCAAVALSTTLLLSQTFQKLSDIELGFEPRGVLAAELTLPQDSASGERWKRLAESLQQRLAAQQQVGVASVALSPPATKSLRASFRVSGQASQGAAGIADYRPVGPDYFRVLRIPVLRGRIFTSSDNARGPAVCLVNNAFSRGVFPQGGEIGALLEPLGVRPCQIVGVVGDVVSRNLRERPPPAIYVPFDQMPDEAIQGFMSMLVRVSEDSPGADRQVSGLVREAVRELAPSLPVQVRSLSEVIGDLAAREGFRSLLMGAVSLLSLLLACAGVYGISANHVAHRRRELAIRLALGSTAGRILGDLVKGALRPTLVGLAIGLACAYPLASLLRGVLYGAESLGVWQAIVVILAMVPVAGLSAYLPGRRIAGLNPADVLRDD